MDNSKLKQVIQKEYKKCATDPIHFMRKYCVIQHPKMGKIKFDLYPFQEKCLADFRPLSLGQIFLGLINDKFSKPKHPIDLKDIPTFSDNWGLFSIN